MCRITVVSLYTPNWEYPAHAARLRAECENLGVPHYIVEKRDTGSYLGNCRWKPHVIREAYDQTAGPLLWIDVDGSLLSVPAIDTDVDFMAHPKPDRDPRQWHVGTLYFGRTEGARVLLDLWVASLTKDASDELAFDRLWKAGWWAGTWAPLPPGYFELEARGVSSHAVVVHRLSRSPQKLAYHGKRK